VSTGVPLRAAGILLILGLLLAVLTACGVPRSHYKLTIGVSYPTANNPFWNAYTRFIDEAARQLGVGINAVSADQNEQRQLSDVENLISQGIDGLIVTPQSTSIAPALLRVAAQAKIPVVVTDRYPGYGPGENKNADYVAFLGPNDEKAGSGIAEALIAAGGSTFLAVGGVPGNSAAEGRKAGLESALEAAGDPLVQFQAAGETEDQGLVATENLLQAHPAGDANAVWCFNDNLCQGAIKATRNAHRESEFVFGGMDLTPQAISAIENGSYTVSFGGQWLEGGFGLAVLYHKINGHEPVERVVKFDLLKVDKSNVAKFRARYLDNTPHYDFTSMPQFDKTITLN
jgi:ABC-type sugar transport system substrate-binding protein